MCLLQLFGFCGDEGRGTFITRQKSQSLGRLPTVIFVAAIGDRKVDIDRFGITAKLFERIGVKKFYFANIRSARRVHAAEIGILLESFERRQCVGPVRACEIDPRFGERRESLGKFSLELVTDRSDPLYCSRLFTHVAENIDVIQIRPIEPLTLGVFFDVQLVTRSGFVMLPDSGVR